MLLRLPHPGLALRLLVRGVFLWIGLRLAYELLRLYAGLPRRTDAASAVLVIALCSAAGFLDVTRRREHVLLGNLAVDRVALLATFAAAAMACEVALAVYLRWS